MKGEIPPQPLRTGKPVHPSMFSMVKHIFGKGQVLRVGAGLLPHTLTRWLHAGVGLSCTVTGHSSVGYPWRTAGPSALERVLGWNSEGSACFSGLSIPSLPGLGEVTNLCFTLLIHKKGNMTIICFRVIEGRKKLRREGGKREGMP